MPEPQTRKNGETLPPQCSGDYAKQIGRDRLCALTAKGIRYWDEIAKLFDHDTTTEMRPCPFAGGSYQAQPARSGLGLRRRRAHPGFAIVYADHDRFPVADRVG